MMPTALPLELSERDMKAMKRLDLRNQPEKSQSPHAKYNTVKGNEQEQGEKFVVYAEYPGHENNSFLTRKRVESWTNRLGSASIRSRIC